MRTGILRDWWRRTFSRSGDEAAAPPDALLGTAAWRRATDELGRDTEEVFVATAGPQDAVFQVSLGWTGAGGEVVLEPDPDSTGEVRVKRHDGRPILLGEAARERIMARVDRPRSHRSRPVIQVSARVVLDRRRIVNRSIPGRRRTSVSVLSIEELYAVSAFFDDAG